MAKHSQHQQETPDSIRSGGGQAVVELCGVCDGGIVFWSRRRFDIGAELQIRIRRDALPQSIPPPAESGEWVTLSGYVVECPPVRRPGGAQGFRVSLLLQCALEACPKVNPNPKSCRYQLRFISAKFPGSARIGLN